MRRAKNFDRNIYDHLVVNTLTTKSSVTTLGITSMNAMIMYLSTRLTIDFLCPDASQFYL